MFSYFMYLLLLTHCFNEQLPSNRRVALLFLAINCGNASTRVYTLGYATLGNNNINFNFVVYFFLLCSISTVMFYVEFPPLTLIFNFFLLIHEM